MRVTAILSVAILSTVASAQADLFDVLDRDKNGRVTADEITAQQRPYFQRALRVSDLNEDGALTRQELTGAIRDPEPVSVSMSNRGRASSMDLKRLDRNNDGKITKSEIPEPLQQRPKRLIDQFGADGIPIDTLQKMAQGQMRQASNNGTKATDTPKPTKTESSMATRRLSDVVKRLDANRDGELSRSELRRAPAVARRLDKNRDGVVSASEISRAATDAPQIRPR